MTILKVPAYKILNEGVECFVEKDMRLTESAQQEGTDPDDQKNEIYAWIELMGLDPGLADVYDDGSWSEGYKIDYDGDVNLSGRNLREIPYKFGTVNGDFNVIDNRLTSFLRFPDVVKGRCMFGFNRMKEFDFSGAFMECDRMIGGVQRCVPDYPLTQVNFEKVKADNMEPRAVVQEKYTGIITGRVSDTLLEVLCDHDRRKRVYDIKDIRMV